MVFVGERTVLEICGSRDLQVVNFTYGFETIHM